MRWEARTLKDFQIHKGRCAPQCRKGVCGFAPAGGMPFQQDAAIAKIVKK